MRNSLLVFAVGVVACSGQPVGPAQPGSSIGGASAPASLRVVNTAPDVPEMDVLVHGRVVISKLAFGAVSAVTSVNAGKQDVAFRASGDTAGPATSLAFTAGDTTTLLTIDSSTVLNPWVLTDTGATVPAGRTKLRVVHFAAHAPALLAWRSQPDFPVLTPIQFPFPYETATPYVESDPGTWQVLVATEAYVGNQPVVTDTLALSDPIDIADGTSRTVIIVDDGSGGVKLVVIDP
jgi:Domain of unknown function (DUF4397)